MQKGVMSQVQTGRQYAKKWPMRQELAPMFAEFRVIKATDLAITVMPILAMFTVFMQVNYLGSDYFPQAITIALFFLSLPFQGLLWLGRRAQTRLEPAMLSWYTELLSKMKAHGYQSQLTTEKPCYTDLAQLLKDMFEKMDKAFTKEHF